MNLSVAQSIAEDKPVFLSGPIVYGPYRVLEEFWHKWFTDNWDFMQQINDDLGIGMPLVKPVFRLFDPDTHLRGFYKSGNIWMVVDRKATECSLRRTYCHEARHHWYWTHGELSPLDEEEKDARQYADRHVPRDIDLLVFNWWQKNESNILQHFSREIGNALIALRRQP